MKNRMFLVSLSLLVIGIIFLVLENSFYQYLDKDGILHESLFLPLGSFCIIFGIFGIAGYLIIKLVKKS